MADIGGRRQLYSVFQVGRFNRGQFLRYSLLTDSIGRNREECCSIYRIYFSIFVDRIRLVFDLMPKMIVSIAVRLVPLKIQHLWLNVY